MVILTLSLYVCIVLHEEIPGDRRGILGVRIRGGRQITCVEEENGMVGASEVRGDGSSAGSGTDYYVVIGGGVGEFWGRSGEDGRGEKE
jgi:hypothetical protein